MIPGPFDADLAARALRAARSIPTPRAQEDEVSESTTAATTRELAECEFDGRREGEGWCWTHGSAWDTCPAHLRVVRAKELCGERSVRGIVYRWFLLALNSGEAEVVDAAPHELDDLLDAIQ